MVGRRHLLIESERGRYYYLHLLSHRDENRGLWCIDSVRHGHGAQEAGPFSYVTVWKGVVLVEVVGRR